MLRQNWLEGDARRRPLPLHPAQPRPLPVAVVLGLVLRGDRLAPLRRLPRPGRAREPALRAAARRLHRPHDLLGPAGLLEPTALLQRRLAQRLPDRDDPAAAARLGLADRRRRPGRGARGSARQMDWLAANRDLEGDGLLWIVQPDESGLDASPKFDPVWGRRANGRLGFPLLVARNRRLGFDARRVAASGGPLLCEVLVNTMWSLSLQALGRPSATPALVERLWDERRGLFLDEAQPGGARPAVLTWAALAPLALPDLPEEIGRRLVEEHLLDAKEFLTPVAPPSVAVGEPSYETGRRPRPDPPLLARADLGQLRLDGLDRAAPPRLRAGGESAGRRTDRRGRARRPARVLRPARRHRPRRQGLRLVSADLPSSQIRGRRRRRAICSGR